MQDLTRALWNINQCLCEQASSPPQCICFAAPSFHLGGVFARLQVNSRSVHVQKWPPGAKDFLTFSVVASKKVLMWVSGNIEKLARMWIKVQFSQSRVQHEGHAVNTRRRHRRNRFRDTRISVLSGLACRC